jgi:hypothetical protein
MEECATNVDVSPLTVWTPKNNLVVGYPSPFGQLATGDWLLFHRETDASSAGINETPASKSSSLSYLIAKAAPDTTSLEYQLSEWPIGSYRYVPVGVTTYIFL